MYSQDVYDLTFLFYIGGDCMIRGTTTSFIFQLPFKKCEIESIKIKFWQPGNSGTREEPLPFYKYLDNCAGDDDATEITVSLSPSETKRFSDKLKAYVQMSAKQISGPVVATLRHLITVYPMDDDLITDTGEEPIIPPTSDGWVIIDGGVINNE